jgi:hypothetical protein
MPQSFEVPNKMKVKNEIDFTLFESKINGSADSCRNQVIRYQQFKN